MDLAKPCLDVGLYTDQLDESLEFAQSRLGLTLEEMLPVGSGVRQHRFGLKGSVLKLNHSRTPLTDAPTGYRRLTIATAEPPAELRSPDGVEVALVAAGTDGVDAIGIDVATPEVGAQQRFLASLGADDLGGARFRLGTTLVRLVHDASAQRAGALGARGFRYLTIQVRDVRAAHARLTAGGVESAGPPRRMGDVAMICFVRDPDGNWIELSQRASLTGPLPAD